MTVQRMEFKVGPAADPNCKECQGTGEMPGTASEEFGFPALVCSCRWYDFEVVDLDPEEVPVLTLEVG